MDGREQLTHLSGLQGAMLYFFYQEAGPVYSDDTWWQGLHRHDLMRLNFLRFTVQWIRYVVLTVPKISIQNLVRLVEIGIPDSL